MKNLRKKKFILVFVLLLGIGTTFAFYQTRHTFENEFLTLEYGAKVEEEFESPNNWKPGDETSKVLAVKNTGDVCENVRVKYTEKWESKNGTVLSNIDSTINENVAIINLDNQNDWIQKGEYYYYNKDLLSGENTTSFLESVTFNPNYSGNITCETITENNQIKQQCKPGEDSHIGGTYTLTFQVETVQCNGMESEWEVKLEELQNKYNVTYHLNGGSLKSTMLSAYPENNEEIVLPEPEKKGYDFTGWYETSDFSSEKVKSIPKNSTGDKEYHANWKIKKYKIKYHLNGGKYSNNPLTTYTVETEENLPIPTKEGYAFKGWKKKKDLTGDSTDKIEKSTIGNKEFYAKWELTNYTITCNLGNIHTGLENQTIQLDSTTSTVPIKNSNLLSLKANQLYMVSFDYIATEENEFDVDLYPDTLPQILPIATTTKQHYDWKLSSSHSDMATGNVRLRFFDDRSPTTDNGVITMTNLIMGEATEKNYTIHSDDYTLSTPTRTGYTFNGWTGSNGNTAQSSISIPQGSTGDKTYTANWTANTYTITYNGNGATGGSTATSTHTYDVAKALTANGFTKTGHTFAGWATSSTGGVVYSNSQSITNLAASGNVTLYAKWTANTYTVSYAGNGATGGSTAATTCTYGQTFTPRANGFTRTGHTFNGWSGSTTCSGNMTMTATWKANTYTVSYAGNGATGGSTAATTCTYGQAFTPRANGFTRTGYTFAGWSGSTTCSGNMTMTATWRINQYRITVNNGTGTGTYNYGTRVTITGTVPGAAYSPACSGTSTTQREAFITNLIYYSWKSWSDGNTSQSRAITVTGNATYTAQFNAVGIRTCVCGWRLTPTGTYPNMSFIYTATVSCPS